MNQHRGPRLARRYGMLLALAGLNLTLYPSLVPAQTTTIEEEQARAERMREAEHQRELDQTRLSERERVRDEERTRASRDRDRDRRHYHDQPGEWYVAGFGGYTLGHNFNDVEGIGSAAGTNLGDIGLKNSGVYGAKIGYFLPNHMNWLGFELEGFNSTPHFEQSGVGPGANLRVTTAAVNVIARAKMACDRRHRDARDDRARRVSTDPDYDDDYGDRKFCRLQPYIGVGVGIFFARASDGASSSDNAVPGLNALAGVRYFFTEHVALFGEYKYNRATFEFDNVGTAGAGLKGDYSVSHLVGGLSFHF